MYTTNGYSIIAEEYEDVTTSYRSPIPNQYAGSPPHDTAAATETLLNGFVRQGYGSLGNVSVSTTDRLVW